MKRSTILGAWTKNLHKRQHNKKKKVREEEVEKLKKKQIERIKKKNEAMKEKLIGKREQEKSSMVFANAFKKLKTDNKAHNRNFIRNSFSFLSTRSSKKRKKKESKGVDVNLVESEEPFFGHFDQNLEKIKEELELIKADKDSQEQVNQVEMNPSLINSYVVLDTDNKDLELDDEDEKEMDKEDPKLMNYSFKRRNYTSKLKFNFEDFREFEFMKRMEDKEVQFPEFPVLEEEIIQYLQNQGNQIPPNFLGLLSILSSYTDFQGQDPYGFNNDAYQSVFLIHILNHILTKKRSNLEQKNGYTKPSVLILAPYRIEAYAIMQLIKRILGYKKILQEEKFNEKFGDEEVSQTTVTPLRSS